MSDLFILCSLLAIAWAAFRTGTSYQAYRDSKVFCEDNIEMLAAAYHDERAQDVVRATAQRIMLLLDEEG